MADLKKIRLANGEILQVDDAVARQSIADEVTRATGAEATLQTNIDAEAARAQAVEAAIDGRISELEAVGRFLSSWDCATGKPATYPDVPVGVTSYTYNFRAGDYYIINNVPSFGTKYMPTGGSISTTD